MKNGELPASPLENAPSHNIMQQGRRIVAGAALAASVILGASCDTGPTERPSMEAVEQLTPAEQLTEATVQLRFTHASSDRKGGGSALNEEEQEAVEYINSDPNCSAAYIGEGWFATASHCFDSALHIGGGYYDQTYDATADLNGTFDVWMGSDPLNMDRIGDVDSVVVNGNITKGDMALVHVDETLIPDNMPALDVTDEAVVDAYSKDEIYYIAGYPYTNGHTKLNFFVEYMGLTSGKDFADSYGLGENLAPMPIFGVRKGVIPNPLDNCRPGMSGSVVLDSSGKVMGVLSRLSLEGDTAWSNTVERLGKETMDGFETLCIVQPLTSTAVEYYKQQQSVPASTETLISK